MLKGLAGSSPPVSQSPLLEAQNFETGLKESKGFTDVLKNRDVDKPRDLKPEKGKVEKEVQEQEPTAPVKKTGDLKVRSQKERAIRKFMDSLEGEFGVPPQKMVDAMTQLQAVDLDKAPEATVNQVIEKLDLKPQQSVQVKQMYVGLLDQLNQIEMRSELPVSTDQLLSQLSADRLQVAQIKKDVTTQQVGQLNQKFWMKTPDVVQPDVAQTLEALPQGEMEQALTMLQEKFQFQAPEVRSDVMKAPIKGLSSESSEPAPQMTLEDLMKVVQSKIESGEVDPKTLDVQEIKTWAPLAMGIKSLMPQTDQLQKLSEKRADDTFSFLSPEGEIEKTMSPEGLSIFQKVMGLESADTQLEKQSSMAEDKTQILETDSNSLGLIQQQPLTRDQQVAAPLPQAPVVNLSPADKIQNNQQLLNQAQVLIQKGGGEMKIQMSPEGMGSVEMKLKVQGGKVELQLSAENKEVKKVLENSIQDLKNSLSAHKLIVDQVRVDVVAPTVGSSEVRQDLQNQMNDFMNQQQRDGNRQFWQQFNENFGNRQARESYFDAQNIRTGMREQKLPGFQESSAPRKLEGNRGRSLNLVA